MAVLDIDAASASVSAPLGQARGLPNAWYTDPQYHREEAHDLFARTWTCVGVGADIPEAGDIMPVAAAGTPIVLVRDKNGAVNAFHNVCSHRGVQLVDAPGKRKPVLRCPYHSWTYGLDGALTHTPMVDGPDKHECALIDKASLGLRPVRVSLWNDLVFVNLSGDAPSLADHMAPLDARWAAYDFSNMRHAANWELTLNANWKLAIENFLESYHLPWVHPSLNDRSPIDKHKLVFISDNHFGQITDQFAADKVDASPFTPFPGLTRAQELSGEYPIIFPNVMLGIQRDHFYCIITDPLAHDRTRERVHLYMVGDAPDRPDYQPAFDTLIETWKEVFEEDIWVVERMQLGRASDAFGGGVLTPYHDDLTQRFMQRVTESLAG
jgi:choline monooxygenase